MMSRARVQMGRQASDEDGFALVMFALCMPVFFERFVNTVMPNGAWGPFQPGSDYRARSIRLVN